MGKNLSRPKCAKHKIAVGYTSDAFKFYQILCTDYDSAKIGTFASQSPLNPPLGHSLHARNWAYFLGISIPPFPAFLEVDPLPVVLKRAGDLNDPLIHAFCDS